MPSEMTYSKAIKELQDNIDLPFGVAVSDEASRMAIKALEKQMKLNEMGHCYIIPKNGVFEVNGVDVNLAIQKQIPKKPIMKQYFDDMEEEYLCCPTCGVILTDRIPMDNKDFYFHCLNCGQKLDWSDEDE